MGLLSVAWLIAALVGAAVGHGALLAFGLGLFLFFGVASWWLSPWRIRRAGGPPK